MRLRVGAATDIGRVRDLNEDVYVLQADTGLFVVCDGMGGAPAGEVASQIGVNAILHHVGAAAEDPVALRPLDGQSYLPHTQRLAEAVRSSNRVIYDQAQRDPRHARMGTTVVAAWVRDHVASVAHVGDSRAYLWHGERLESLTHDHSLVEAEVVAGLIDRDEARRAVEQNVLVRVLGREPHVDVDVKEVPVEPGDYLLLCSDGLTRMVPEDALARTFATVSHPQQICDRLIAAANGNGGADNITVVVVEVKEPWWRQLMNYYKRRDTGAPDGEAHSEVRRSDIA